MVESIVVDHRGYGHSVCRRCPAFAGIMQGRAIGQIGSINAYVRPVSCSVGLGVKTF